MIGDGGKYLTKGTGIGAEGRAHRKTGEPRPQRTPHRLERCGCLNVVEHERFERRAVECHRLDVPMGQEFLTVHMQLTQDAAAGAQYRYDFEAVMVKPRSAVQ